MVYSSFTRAKSLCFKIKISQQKPESKESLGELSKRNGVVIWIWGANSHCRLQTDVV